MLILVTGGSGFIGKALIQALQKDGHQIVCWTRDAKRTSEALGETVEIVESLEAISSTPDAIINLAGAPIADQRWSEQRKRLLRDSRIGLTEKLLDWVSIQHHKPQVLISGSAIGYYGSYSEDRSPLLDEETEAIDGFTYKLCHDWEQVALRAESQGIRVCVIRTGVVLGKDGGALKKMLPPFRFGLGGPVGSGKQWMSWIHMTDQVNAIRFLLEHPELKGAFNLTAPESVSNAEFSKMLANALSRPCWMPVPAMVIKLMLGEGAELLLEGQRVYPKRLLDAGFNFEYPALKVALDSGIL